jgi:hypothetical protein
MSVEKQCVFGGVSDVLFLILSMGDASTIPTLCRLNKVTYQTIKAHETLICTSFLRHHNMPPLDRILTLCHSTGQPCALNFISLQKFMYRRNTAQQLASRVARSGWGAWWAIKGAGEMDAEAELFRQRVERGLYVMFHMSDIAREVERTKLRPCSIVFRVHHDLLFNSPPCSQAQRPRRTNSWWFPRHMAHIYVVLFRKSRQREIGKRRWQFRQLLDLERRVDFHIALQMLRHFLETIIFAHNPDDDRSIRSASEDFDVTSWFLLRLSSHSLARIFLELPDAKCCSVEDRARTGRSKERVVCNYSEALKDYWNARSGDPTLDCRYCEACLRSSSTDGILNDFFGQHAYELAREWVRQMRGEGELLFDF